MTRGSLALAVTLALAACHSARTELVVVVTTDGIAIPRDVDTVQITVTDETRGDVVYTSPPNALCAGGDTMDCERLPMVLTLVPGPTAPADPSRVEVKALRGGETVIDDVAVFTFVTGLSQRLDFILSGACLAHTGCAASERACVSGQCTALVPTPLGAEPALDGGAPLIVDAAPLPPDAPPLDAAPDAATQQDLAASDSTLPADLAATPDLAVLDLAAGTPPDLLAMLDLARPAIDLAPPTDLVHPIDLQLPPDLAPSSDLVAPADLLPPPDLASPGIALRGARSVIASPASLLTVTQPVNAAQAGDFMLLGVYIDTNTVSIPTPTTPTGWTLLSNFTFGFQNDGFSTYWYSKVAASGEGSCTIALSGSSYNVAGALIVYSGVSTTSPLIDSNFQADKPEVTYVAPAVTSNASGARLVAFFIRDFYDPTDTWVMGVPTGMTQQITVLNFGVFDQALTATGATGTRTAMLDSQGSYAAAGAASFVLRPR